MHITPQAVHTLALQRIAALLERAARHRATAAGRPGDPRNMTLASMIDTLADEGAAACATYCDVLDLAGATADSTAVTAAWRMAASQMIAHSQACRMASWHMWALHPQPQQVAA